jgi:hypothetical protein
MPCKNNLKSTLSKSKEHPVMNFYLVWDSSCGHTVLCFTSKNVPNRNLYVSTDGLTWSKFCSQNIPECDWFLSSGLGERDWCDSTSEWWLPVSCSALWDCGECWPVLDLGECRLTLDVGDRWLASDLAECRLTLDVGERWLVSDPGECWLTFDAGECWLAYDLRECLLLAFDTADLGLALEAGECGLPADSWWLLAFEPGLCDPSLDRGLPSDLALGDPTSVIFKRQSWSIELSLGLLNVTNHKLSYIVSNLALTQRRSLANLANILHRY